jgi:hypothetical protein
MNARTLQRLRDALDVLADTPQGAREWRAVERSLANLEDTLARDDAEAARSVASALEGKGTRITRIGASAKGREPSVPIPQPMLLRRNKLIHEIDARLRELQAQDPPAPNA